MSKFRARISTYLGVLLWLMFTAGSCLGQSAAVTISIEPGVRSTAIVEGTFQEAGPHREVKFLTQFGPVRGLDRRLSKLELFDKNRNIVISHIVEPGRNLAESDLTSWRYRADLTPLTDRFAAAHVSWADESGAFIALDDLLPLGLKSVRLTVNVPRDWMVYSVEPSPARGVFDVAEPSAAVIHAGPKIRSIPVQMSGANLNLLIMGDWLFTDAEAMQMAESIFRGYASQFGRAAAKDIQIAIRPFPMHVPNGQWEADSRGRSVTVVSSDMPFKSQSIQRLHEQLRHEIFHLWIPNAVSLTGNYDWFYEGFALYNSLKAGVAVNQIRFEDFLDTLSRAYAISNSDSTGRSLIQQSQDRWSGSNTMIYARGMLIAFLSDIALLNATKGKRSVSDILKGVFVKYHKTISYEGNDAVVGMLAAEKELRPIVERNVLGVQPLDLARMLEGSGLELSSGERSPRIKVADRPSGRGKEVLDRLGYNNWRKLPRNDK